MTDEESVSNSVENDDNDELPWFSFEIIGVNLSFDGRSCDIHECCGDHLEVGDIVRMVNNDVGETYQVKAVLIDKDEGESCTVGFIPDYMLHLPSIAECVGMYGRVVELYHKSKNPYLRRKADNLRGIAAILLLDDESDQSDTSEDSSTSESE